VEKKSGSKQVIRKKDSKIWEEKDNKKKREKHKEKRDQTKKKEYINEVERKKRSL
jgi:hypothetical protein